MTAPVSIELAPQPIERIACDLVVAGIFAGDRPLRGGAARIDWRACGLFSRLVASERMVGNVGEAVLVPSEGALRAPRALVLGLGERAHFPLTAAQDAMRVAFDHCFDLGVGRVALAPLGFASDDLPRHAPALVGGLLEAARPRVSPLSLAVALPRSEHPQALQALERALRAVEPEPLSLQKGDAPGPRAATTRGGREAGPGSVRPV